MYRILATNQPVRERRNQREHPQYAKPELVATAPNQTWSWDITKLLGPTKWTYFYLYVVLDIFSRYAVGWMVADRENSALAACLIEQYFGQFWQRGSRTRPPILELCYPTQPRMEVLHATASECTCDVAPNQETATKVHYPSAGACADASRPCHVS